MSSPTAGVRVVNRDTKPVLAARELTALLWPDGDRPDRPQVHAVIDAACDPRIIDMLRATGLEKACLFSGTLSPALQAAAPYLVHLAPGAKLAQEIFDFGLGENWFTLCIVQPNVTLMQLRKHLRTLLRVRDEEGRRFLFRFYDPRVLRIYLPTCTPSEATRVFGPTQAFVCADDDPLTAICFDRRDPATAMRIGKGWSSTTTAQTFTGYSDQSTLTIRDGQARAFKSVGSSIFEDQMVAHIHRCLPKSREIHGETQLRVLIRRGMVKAGKYRLTAQRDVCKFIDAMILLGEDFDEGHEYPWAESILQSDDPAEIRTRRLFEWLRGVMPAMEGH